MGKKNYDKCCQGDFRQSRAYIQSRIAVVYRKFCDRRSTYSSLESISEKDSMERNS